MSTIHQHPVPGSVITAVRGDLLKITLSVPTVQEGKAFFRTDKGKIVDPSLEEAVKSESGGKQDSLAWHDIPMTKKSSGQYETTLPLSDVGVFHGKCFFLENSGKVRWPEGANITLKVEPALSVASNTIYSAFTRLFKEEDDPAIQPDTIKAAEPFDRQGYTVIPPSGTFRNLTARLDTIMGKMGFRIIQLLPIHPTPTTYARMGRYGSPFAALDFFELDPALAEFDRKTTPMEQFRELVDAVHARGGLIFMDIPVNHTGWASNLQMHHPEWFVRDNINGFHSPGAWGVTWADLSKLDYSKENKDLWKYMSDVFLFWCGQHVDGFRCDAGYMIPAGVWKYIVARVRAKYPDTIFLLENLGGRWEVTEQLLIESGLNWAYSELFQNTDRRSIDHYFPEHARISESRGLLTTFAETHDNNRLAATSIGYSKFRTVFSALFAPAGAFGITCGVEWFANAKISVHGFTPLKWDNPINQVDALARLNNILNRHPAFHYGAKTDLIHKGAWNTVVLKRTGRNGDTVIIAANISDSKPEPACWDAKHTPQGENFYDLITGLEVEVETTAGGSSIGLEPLSIVCLTNSKKWLDGLDNALTDTASNDNILTKQALKAAAMSAVVRIKKDADWAGLDSDALGKSLWNDPYKFCADLSGEDSPPRVTRWVLPRDIHRNVPVPRGNIVLLESDIMFYAEVFLPDGRSFREKSIISKDGTFFALMIPPPMENQMIQAEMEVTLLKVSGASCVRSSVIFLGSGASTKVTLKHDSESVVRNNAYALCTNGRGAMSLLPGQWGRVFSQYDCIIAANLDPQCPSDRHVMLTRCRGWLVHKDFSQELSIQNLDWFTASAPDSAHWRFSVPVGQGKLVELECRLMMHQHQNAITMTFERLENALRETGLSDDQSLRLILRFDIEDRNFHTKTKAFAGPESYWTRATTPTQKGFIFEPARDRRLELKVSDGKFTSEPEWYYMVPHPVDAERGLDGTSDLFSPGYFTLTLRGGSFVDVHAAVTTAEIRLPPFESIPRRNLPAIAPLKDTLKAAMRQFMVARNETMTVIAGYPWFLDWGRDTLICLRGITAAGFYRESVDILKQFAIFEENGTLPNMIRGHDASNRDTSDAPLWFIIAADDLIRRSGSAELLDMDCNGRSLKEVILSIGRNYARGTHNGIKMDETSGLIYSPSHFTWMDTNFPAGSPREGYPVEIQALWIASLTVLARIDRSGNWMQLHNMAKKSMRQYFTVTGRAWLSDCLHTQGFASAKNAVADDALKPNQLFAVTLDAVEKSLWQGIIASCEELLIPGSIRSLADRPVKHHLPVHHNGKLLNDPANPYWGYYSGDEDTRRKPAYHNGTGWSWVFPSYSEGLLKCYGKNAVDTALSVLSSSEYMLNQGCIAQLPEICDGHHPHTPKGCPAQAWSVTELYRVLDLAHKLC